MSLVKKQQVEFDVEAITRIAGVLSAAFQAVEEVSDGLAEFRKALDLTQGKVAAATRVPVFRIAKAEQGSENLPFDDAVAVARWMLRAAKGEVAATEYEQDLPRVRAAKATETETEDGAAEEVEFATDSKAAHAPPKHALAV